METISLTHQYWAFMESVSEKGDNLNYRWAMAGTRGGKEDVSSWNINDKHKCHDYYESHRHQRH